MSSVQQSCRQIATSTHGGDITTANNMQILTLIVLGALAFSSATAQQCGQSSKLARYLGGFGRIVGGREAPRCGFPWQVRLNPLCGGSVISRRHVLTAAHCVQDLRAHQMSVFVGDHDRTRHDGTETEIPVKKIIIHGHYNNVTVENDVAILLLEWPMDYSDCVQPVCLDPNHHYDGHECTVSGWGTTSWEGQVSDKLMMVQVTTAYGERCRDVFNIPVDWYHGDPKAFICAGVKEGGKDSCQGDSGGPLVCRKSNNQFVQVGVVSWGGECALKGYPGWYSNLRTYHRWIHETMRIHAW